MRFPVLVLTCVMLVAHAGCGHSQGPKPAPTPTTASTNDPSIPTRPQGRLPTMKVWVGPAEITAELALSADQIRTGMMFRSQMGENEGMLFVFPVPHRTGFWMKNVTVPLSCAYVDAEGSILEIHDMEPGNEKPIFATSDRVQYVLETPRGWFEKNGVRPGMATRTERGTLRETFFGRSAPR